MIRLIAVWLITLVCAMPAMAVNPDEVLADPVLETRARDLSKDLRCVVCRNQSIDDSNAGIARDMRIVLRERLVAGDTDQEAFDYLVDRYGAYVLLDPPVNPTTYLLWVGPLLFFLAALFGFSRIFRKARATTDLVEELSDEDRALVRSLLNDEETL
ncbi:cytochrome c-type biogenesis protein [Actibacterium pelagium]|uniref:Cytochrome c-type biogenesis protein n=1 Tax=Actibacterium pelagium TaxID=2029103 RepID=A0A917ABM0_9RHOB|nr:cytochrome c-type biogenesis protein [Actibacterium pelagium]GGE41560.1 hypothetical protein GCM10011517_06440 [Actibacterium pelagium]